MNERNIYDEDGNWIATTGSVQWSEVLEFPTVEGGSPFRLKGESPNIPVTQTQFEVTHLLRFGIFKTGTRIYQNSKAVATVRLA